MNQNSKLPQESMITSPKDNDLEPGNTDLTRTTRETEVNKVPPQPSNHIGKDTTGVGQPSLQSVNQGQSLPAAPATVDKGLGVNAKLYHPMDEERAIAKKNMANSGAQKTEE